LRATFMRCESAAPVMKCSLQRGFSRQFSVLSKGKHALERLWLVFSFRLWPAQHSPLRRSAQSLQPAPQAAGNRDLRVRMTNRTWLSRAPALSWLTNVPQALQCLRRTGGGDTFFFAFSASFIASCVPSMASSKLSL